jgi:hypothetical protein
VSINSCSKKYDVNKDKCLSFAGGDKSKMLLHLMYANYFRYSFIVICSVVIAPHTICSFQDNSLFL